MGYIRTYERDIYATSNLQPEPQQDDFFEQITGKKPKKSKEERRQIREERKQIKEFEDAAVFKRAKKNQAPYRFPSSGMESNPFTQERVDLSKLPPPKEKPLPPFEWQYDPKVNYLINEKERLEKEAEYLKTLSPWDQQRYKAQKIAEENKDRQHPAIERANQVISDTEWRTANYDYLYQGIMESRRQESQDEWYNDYIRRIREPSTKAYQNIYPSYYDENTISNRKPNYNNGKKYLWFNDIGEDGKPGTMHTLRVDPNIIKEIHKFADQGNLDPHKRLRLMALSANESMFGKGRDIFGINNIFSEYGYMGYIEPDSWAAKQYERKYNGDVYHDYWTYISEATDNMENMDKWNSRYVLDKKINPKGETYTQRLEGYEKKLLKNPEFMKMAFGEEWEEIFKDRLKEINANK